MPEKHTPAKSTIDSREIAKFSALSQHWWDKNGELKTLHDINPVRLQYIQQITAINGKRVLDVGCGGGILAESMAKGCAQVTAIDAESEAIVTAKAHAVSQNVSIDYQVSSIEDYEAEPFDVITCMEMLEHVNHPETVIEHCSRLLKPDGYLFLSTINRSAKAYATAIVAAEYILKLLPRQTHDYAKFIKPAELALMARQQGLELIGLKGMAYNPFSRKAALQESVAVNYLMCFRKPVD